MKYIKTYEQKNEPQIGDYVVVKFPHQTDIGRMLENYIGQIIDTTTNKKRFYVKFGTLEYYIEPEHIYDFSPNKEDLEKYIAAKKYNI